MWASSKFAQDWNKCFRNSSLNLAQGVRLLWLPSMAASWPRTLERIRRKYPVGTQKCDQNLSRPLGCAPNNSDVIFTCTYRLTRLFVYCLLFTLNCETCERIVHYVILKACFNRHIDKTCKKIRLIEYKLKNVRFIQSAIYSVFTYFYINPYILIYVIIAFSNYITYLQSSW